MSLSLRDRLDALGCPFTQDLDDDAVEDLLLSPGDGRLRVLQWLIGSFHPRLSELFDGGHRAEAKVINLVTAAHAMLLCSKDDVALIKGDAPLPQQKAFVDKLLALCTQRMLPCGRPGTDDIVSTLAETDLIACLNQQWRPTLLPKDIASELSSRQQDGETARLPSLKALVERSEQVSEELGQYTKELEHLQTTVRLQGLAKSAEVSTLSHMLSTLLHDLCQLMEAFGHCFQSRLGLWCHKPPPQLSQLGPTLARVHAGLESFIEMVEGIHSIRTLHTKLLKADPATDLRRIVDPHGPSESPSLHHCLPVLEESLHRRQANFTSRFHTSLAERCFSVCSSH